MSFNDALSTLEFGYNPKFGPSYSRDFKLLFILRYFSELGRFLRTYRLANGLNNHMNTPGLILEINECFEIFKQLVCHIDMFK